MWQWCVCARTIGLLYIHVPHVAYKPNCKVIHFLKYCNSYSIDHYCSYLHNWEYFLCQHSILFLQLVSGFTGTTTNMCETICQAHMYTYCHSGIVFFYYAACVDFSATFPAADLFATCYRYALAVQHG